MAAGAAAAAVMQQLPMRTSHSQLLL